LGGGLEFEACLGAILDAAIFFTSADKGTLQLLDPSARCLVIRAQRGFGQPFLDFFSFVHIESDATCGVAFGNARRVIVEDVTASGLFAGKPAGAVLLNEGVRAVQSTPLVCPDGHVVGVVSTHFTQPSRLGHRELRYLDVLSRQAADFVEREQT
jgi:GAF domain-containing protein